MEEWSALGDSLKHCACLVEILDFGWSKSLLAHRFTSVHLDKRDIGDVEAVVISALLPRAASTLNVLQLG